MKALARITIALLVWPMTAAWIPPLSAEEMLEKDKARFLGWQASKSEFLTCGKNVVKIDTGKVVKTIAKCQGPVFVSQGQTFTVKTVDADNRTFRMADEKGDPLSVYYPEIAEKATAMKFDWIKPGQVVGVDFVEAKSTKNGRVVRAESIKELN